MKRFILIYFPVICIAVAALYELYSQDLDLSKGKVQPLNSIGNEKSPAAKRPTYIPPLNRGGRPVILEQPKLGSRVLYNVDKNDPVYVIERTNSQYYRVVVDGKRGYVSKYTLNQK